MAGKILIADDSLKIQKHLTGLLEAKGFEVTAVSNGEFAVRKLPDVLPDLVLADVFMPVRTGYEVCEFIKQSEEFAHIPVLLLASTLEPFDEDEAKRVGIDGKIEKPIADDAATVETILGYLNRAQGGTASAPVVDADEFAAAVPEAPAEDELETIVVAPSEPEPEDLAAPPPSEPEPVAFEESDSPMGFADLMDGGSAEAAAAETPEEKDHDEPFAAALGEDTSDEDSPELAAETHAAESGVDVADFEEEAQSGEEEFSMDTIASQADEVETETEPEPDASTEPELVTGAEDAVDAPAREIEKAELAAPWEMTEAPEGAPEIKQAGGWEGQDWDEPEGPIIPPGERLGPSPEELEAGEEAEETVPATVEEEAAEEDAGEQRFSPEALAAIFDQAEAEIEAEEEAAAASAAAPATDSGDVNLDAMVEEIAKKVVEHLPPEVLEKLSRDLAKEIARPLAEKLIKEKLSE